MEQYEKDYMIRNAEIKIEEAKAAIKYHEWKILDLKSQ